MQLGPTNATVLANPVINQGGDNTYVAEPTSSARKVGQAKQNLTSDHERNKMR